MMGTTAATSGVQGIVIEDPLMAQVLVFQALLEVHDTWLHNSEHRRNEVSKVFVEGSGKVEESLPDTQDRPYVHFRG